MKPTYYYDQGHGYLELHALRAPLGPYTGKFSEENDPQGENYNLAVLAAIYEFQNTHKVTLWTLGRSGRHVCIEDTPNNRKSYRRLQRYAIKAAEDLWASMKA